MTHSRVTVITAYISHIQLSLSVCVWVCGFGIVVIMLANVARRNNNNVPWNLTLSQLVSWFAGLPPVTPPPPSLSPLSAVSAACLHSVRLMSCSIINRFSVLRRFVCTALVYRPSPSPDSRLRLRLGLGRQGLRSKDWGLSTMFLGLWSSLCCFLSLVFLRCAALYSIYYSFHFGLCIHPLLCSFVCF